MLSEIQQHLFHYFNLVKVVPLKAAIKFFETLLNETCPEILLNESNFIEEISSLNKTIKKYDLEIVECVDELTKEKLCILINTADNFLTQNSKFYDNNTTMLFSKIVKDCMISKEGYISETHCLNLNGEVETSKSNVQNVLEKLFADKWLVIMNGLVYLGMRSIVELEQNLKQLYPNEINHCPLCKLMVIHGYICQDCTAKCHYACIEKYFNQSKLKSSCPKCKAVGDNLSFHLKTFETKKSNQTESSSTENHFLSKKRKKQ